MLPTVDEEVLRKNPQFKILYEQLISKALNPDGSTKDEKGEQRRAAVKQELDIHRFKAAKHHLLANAVASAIPQDSKSSHIPSHSDTADPLLDLLFLLPTLLDAERSLPTEAVNLLFSSPPLSDLEVLIPDVASITSTALRSSALNLSRIAHPTTNPSYLHRHISSLSKDFSSLLSNHAESHALLIAKRHETLQMLLSLLETYTEILTQLIRIIESKHNVASRHLELRAKEVSLQSQISEKEVETARADLHTELYDAETVTAIRNYLTHLKDARIRVAERTKGLEAELGEFGVGVDEGKETTMRTLAQEYGRLKKEKSEVRGDLSRLEES